MSTTAAPASAQSEPAAKRRPKPAPNLLQIYAFGLNAVLAIIGIFVSNSSTGNYLAWYLFWLNAIFSITSVIVMLRKRRHFRSPNS